MSPIKFPIESRALAIDHLRTVIGGINAQKAWRENIVDGKFRITDEQWPELDIEFTDDETSPIVFNNAAGLLWALFVLPSALTASERASILLAISPPTDAKTAASIANETAAEINEQLANVQRIADATSDTILMATATLTSAFQTINDLQAMVDISDTVRKNLTHLPSAPARTRITDYVSPEAARMYREMKVACNASKAPFKRFICKEWRDDYKNFERYFLEFNMTELADKPKHFVPRHEGIIACPLNDTESPLHGQLVYGPGTVMFVSKENQNFYNRNKRDFPTRLAVHLSKGTVTEKEFEFMRRRTI